MSFEIQTIGAFLEGRDHASELLMEMGVRKNPLPLEDGFILQAASNVLQTSRNFYGLQIARLTQMYHTAVYRRLNAFEERDELLTSWVETPGRAPGGSPRLYEPTELGAEILDQFQVHY